MARDPGAQLRRSFAGCSAAMGRRLVALGVVGVHDPGNVSPDGSAHRVRCLRGDGRCRRAADPGPRLPPVGGSRTGVARGASGAGSDSGTAPGRAGEGRLAEALRRRDARLADGRPPGAARRPPATWGSSGCRRRSFGDLAGRAAEVGIASQIHAIGDAAARASLDALEPTVGQVPLMPRLEHVQLLHPDDLGRLARLGIAASVQPVHLREDAATAPARLGRPGRGLGLHLAEHPRVGRRCSRSARTRRSSRSTRGRASRWPSSVATRGGGATPQPFGPHEALTLEQALRAATIGPSVDGPGAGSGPPRAGIARGPPRPARGTARVAADASAAVRHGSAAPRPH